MKVTRAWTKLTKHSEDELLKMMQAEQEQPTRPVNDNITWAWVQTRRARLDAEGSLHERASYGYSGRQAN